MRLRWQHTEYPVMGYLQPRLEAMSDASRSALPAPGAGAGHAIGQFDYAKYRRYDKHGGRS